MQSDEIIEAKATDYMKSLLAGVQDLPCDPKQKVDRYYETANMFLDKGFELGRDAADMDKRCTAYVYFMRFASMGVHTIPKHPARKVNSKEDRAIQRALPKIIEKMEQWKVQIKEDYIAKLKQKQIMEEAERQRRISAASVVPNVPDISEFYDDVKSVDNLDGDDLVEGEDAAGAAAKSSQPPAAAVDTPDLRRLRQMMDNTLGHASATPAPASLPSSPPQSLFPSPTVGKAPGPIDLCGGDSAAEATKSGRAVDNASSSTAEPADAYRRPIAHHQDHLSMGPQDAMRLDDTVGLKPPAFNPAVQQSKADGLPAWNPPPPLPMQIWQQQQQQRQPQQPQQQQPQPQQQQAGSGMPVPAPIGSLATRLAAAAVPGVVLDKDAGDAARPYKMPLPAPLQTAPLQQSKDTVGKHNDPPPAYPFPRPAHNGEMPVPPAIGSVAAADAVWRNGRSAAPSQTNARPSTQTAVTAAASFLPPRKPMASPSAPAPRQLKQRRPQRVLKVYGDGHCLYRSVACFLNPDIARLERNAFGIIINPADRSIEEAAAKSLRIRVASYLEENWDKFPMILVEERSSRLAGIRGSEWGGEEEIAILAACLRVSIRVHDIGRNHDHTYSPDSGVTSKMVHLRYTRNEEAALVSGDLEAGGHYDLFID